MPPKRRKYSTSTEGSRGDDDVGAPTPKRRRPAIQYDPVRTLEICQELYDTVRNHRTEDGKILCEPFIRAPNKRTDPEFYNVVTTPMDMLKIQHKLRSEEYDEIDQLTADIELLIDNTKAYFMEGTSEHTDACALWDLYNDTKNILLSEVFGEDVSAKSDSNAAKDEKEDDASSVATDAEEDNQYEQLFCSIVLAKEGGREICEMFKLLPSKSAYPDYFEVIKNPIDLKMIATRVQENQYKSLDDIVRDLNLLVNNAKLFNEPGSQIYKDAQLLKKVIGAKRIEVESQRHSRGKSSERIRTRSRAPGGRALSAVFASYEYDSEEDIPPAPMEYEEDDEEVEDKDEDSQSSSLIQSPQDPAIANNPFWTFYKYILEFKNEAGNTISDPFMRLPNKRIYPDYYTEITKPLSLLNVKKKLKFNQYRAMEPLANDLERVFNNAMQYNIETSQLYKDAKHLRTLTQRRFAELVKELEGTEIAIRATPRGRRTLDTSPPNTGRRKTMGGEEQLTKRLNLLYRIVYDYKDHDARPLITIFVQLPSKKEYPDYYQVISDPMDMTMIENKIKVNKYHSEQGLVSDMELMFNNARHYNEENSQVYKDADTLERVLKGKMKTLVPLDSPKRAIRRPGPKYKFATPLIQKLQDLYNGIKDFHDPRGRVLSTPFIKLPNRNEYPDYYEVIKRPIDMTKIQQKISGQGHSPYDNMEDMVADFVLMFDNACKYNEPDSLIYKDALTLQRICLEKKAELSLHDDKNNVPDVKQMVQQVMTNLFVATYNHADEDSRGFSDSFSDMPSVPQEVTDGTEEVNTKRRIPSFEQVKRNLDRGRYRRIDRFQEDMFEVFEYARKVSRSDSQLYEDASELQLYFVKKRDELCKNGETMLTPALSVTSTILGKEIESERKEKMGKEAREKEESAKENGTEEGGEKEEGAKEDEEEKKGENAITYKDQTYSIGDFVYVEPREKELEPHIVCIEKIWQGENEEQSFSGCWYYRPKETYHVATRKFLEKEVFKSDFHEPVSFNRIMGKCFIMSVRDYFKMKPEGFSEKDVYVCESRYSCRHRAFKKIKVSLWPHKGDVKIVARETPLVPVRVPSVFAEKGAEALSDDIPEGEPFYLDRKREMVDQEVETNDGNKYYEQLKTSAGWCKLGDHVYVRSDEDRPYIARIDKMWTDSGSNMYFRGPWYVHPQDVQHSPTRLFYRQEVFRSTIEDTNPMLSIQGRCCVLTPKEYCTSRPTEILEQDIYICESKYNEAEKAIKKIPKATAVKKTAYSSSKVIDDEFFFFKKPITPGREPSPLLLKAAEEPYVDNFEAPATPTTTLLSSTPTPSTPSETPASEDGFSEKGDKIKKKKSGKHWQPSGYLVFSAEMRKSVQDANPDLSFGEISKLVGQKWRDLEDGAKSTYEDKAKKIAGEQAAKQEAAEKAFNESLSQYPRSQSPASPAPTRPPGYSGPGYPLTSQAYQHTSTNSFVNSSAGHTTTVTSGTSSTQPSIPQRPASPVFVAVPPRTQRLVHSEAYLRYIEGLEKDSSSVSNWDKTLTATQENTPLDRNSRLPTHWLSQGAGHHGDTVSALWALRDLMLKDSLTVCRSLDISEI